MKKYLVHIIYLALIAFLMIYANIKANEAAMQFEMAKQNAEEAAKQVEMAEKQAELARAEAETARDLAIQLEACQSQKN